jgi:uncharacterized protein
MAAALITGATAGIGAAFAERLASDGYDLIVVARDKARLTAQAATLADRHQISVVPVVADLSTERGVDQVATHAGQVDLSINNAGFRTAGRFLDVPLEDEQRMLQLHCAAVLRLTHAAAAGMAERGGGSVINVASVAAFISRGTYGASKAWVVSFSRGVGADLRSQGVHVMALCPGFVHTELHTRGGIDATDVPSFLWLTPEQVVTAAMNDLARRATTSIPGIKYKAIVAAARLIPPRLTTPLSTRLGRGSSRDRA